MPQHSEFSDHRLAVAYDAECRWARDDDFFLSVVSETPGARVLDLGCGTGRLALGMAAAGHTVTGVDPDRAALAAARAKPGAERVTWVAGTASVLPDASFDVAVMTSHVAQYFTGDDDWAETLADLRRALVPGGRIAFDSRDPRARGWERWNPIDSRRRIELPDGCVVTRWFEVTSVRDGSVGFTSHIGYPSGEVLSSPAVLRFRTGDELRASLLSAGFTVERMYGGWDREPVGAGDGELVVIAHT
ncbi:class I SAM-dependent methyltransferase [Streptomyces sp. CAU 1734]|uniref:class I SAM-dependent methyltransferase n=1 Tax=Streptomyces sp. CAU 1734 TaxID=3140360 RepID=UPI0032612065